MVREVFSILNFVPEIILGWIIHITLILKSTETAIFTVSLYKWGHGSKRLGKLPTITEPAGTEVRIILWLILSP